MADKKTSLRTRIANLAIVSTVCLACVIAVQVCFQYYWVSMVRYTNYAETIARIEDNILAEAHIGDVIREGVMNDEYYYAREVLSSIKSDSDVAYIYAVYFEDIDDLYSMKYVINGARPSDLEKDDNYYSDLGDECEPDDYDEGMREAFAQSVRNASGELAYYENVTVEYGHMLTCYRAIFDSEGKAVGVLAVDLDVTVINKEIGTYIIGIITMAILVTIIVCFLFIRMTNRSVTGPVTKISRSAGSFVKMMNDNVAPEELVFEPVEVKINDEIKALSGDVQEMAESVKHYMINLETVTKEKERIGAELSVATQIQADMLPRIFPPFPDRTEFDLYATMDPAKEVGGDFYDFFLTDNEHIGLVMADVSGKGVPAALFMVIAKTLIKNRAMMGGTPSEILSYVNDQLCEGNEAELFVTVWFAILEVSTGKGIAANAGHEHPVIRRADGEWELVVYRHSPAVATMEGVRFREHEFELHPGDSLFVYTDGVAEATDMNNELYGTDRMLDVLSRNKDATPEELLKRVREDINAFVGEAPQFDDITMMNFVYKGKQ